MGARGAELQAPGVAGGAGGPAPSERASAPPRTLPCPLSEAAGAVDGEGAPPGGVGAQAAEMRVNEKYSTLPAEDRSVHIINICAIEDAGHLPSEGTVSAGAVPGARGARGARGACGTPTRARGARPPACTQPAICGSRAALLPTPPIPRAARRPSLGPGSASLWPRVGAESLLPGAQTGALGGTFPSYGGGQGGGGWQPPGPTAPPLWRQLRPFGVRAARVSLTCPGARSSQGARPERELPAPGAAGGL